MLSGAGNELKSGKIQEKDMKTGLYYFSATGNTARAVESIATRLRAAGQEVSLQAVDARTVSPAEIPDLTMIAFPVWSWAAPHFMLDFVRRLPKAGGARAAVFATCGGFGAQAVPEVTRLLRRRGYDVVCSGEAAYPDNWVLAMDAPTGPELESALAKGDERVAQFAENLLSETSSLYPCAWGHKLWSWPMALLFRTFGRRFLGKAFIADETCTSCERCAKDCPVQAISMEGAPSTPRWSATCAACYRCINLCPVQAIQISVPLLILHLGLNLALTILCLGSIGWIHRNWVTVPGIAGAGIATLVAVVLLSIATMLQLSAVDRVFYWFAKRPALRGFFLRNYTHRFGRYRAPGFHPTQPGI